MSIETKIMSEAGGPGPEQFGSPLMARISEVTKPDSSRVTNSPKDEIIDVEFRTTGPATPFPQSNSATNERDSRNSDEGPRISRWSKLSPLDGPTPDVSSSPANTPEPDSVTFGPEPALGASGPPQEPPLPPEPPAPPGGEPVDPSEGASGGTNRRSSIRGKRSPFPKRQFPIVALIKLPVC